MGTIEMNKRRQEMKSIWIAQLDTSNFTFHATGITEDDAREAMMGLTIKPKGKPSRI